MDFVPPGQLLYPSSTSSRSSSTAAVFGNYVPIVVISCIYSTFLRPILYLYKVQYVTDLNSNVPFFWGMFAFTGSSLVIDDELLYPFQLILQDFVKMLLFGVVHPLCALLLGLSVLARIYVLLAGIYLYAGFQTRDMEAVGKLNLSSDYEHLDSICDDIRRNVKFLIWPSLLASSVIFGLFIFDMAFDDSANNDSLAGPISLFVLHIAHFVFVYILFGFAVKKVLDSLELRATSFFGSLDDDEFAIPSGASTSLNSNHTPCVAQTMTVSPMATMNVSEHPKEQELVELGEPKSVGDATRKEI